MKRNVEYPKETKGTKLAREVRARCNSLTREQRQELFRRGMDLIFAYDRKEIY